MTGVCCCPFFVQGHKSVLTSLITVILHIVKAFGPVTDVDILKSERVRTLDHVERTIFWGYTKVVEKVKAWLQGLDSLQVACRRQGFCTRTTPGIALQPLTNRVPRLKTLSVSHSMKFWL
jgi:hypothetical protein